MFIKTLPQRTVEARLASLYGSWLKKCGGSHGTDKNDFIFSSGSVSMTYVRVCYRNGTGIKTDDVHVRRPNGKGFNGIQKGFTEK